jgi:hypothetical protein
MNASALQEELRRVLWERIKAKKIIATMCATF